MELDLGEFFARYERLAKGCSDIFESMKGKYPKEVTCKEGCTDCCYALFDLTLIEAMYINKKIQRNCAQGHAGRNFRECR